MVAVGQRIIGKRYIIHQPLGTGGMGTVYRATDRLNAQTVALKQVQMDALDTDSAARMSLTREFQTLASLRHPNIVGVLDYGFDNARTPYFTMTLIENAETIRDAAKKLPLAGRLDLLIQVLQALTYVHRRGILHRDLKPENTLVNGEGHVKVLDFGVAVIQENVDPWDLAGTPQYISPEVWIGEPPTAASDIYAVGVMAYEILANRPLYIINKVNDLVEQILHAPPDLAPIIAWDLNQHLGAPPPLSEAPSAESHTIRLDPALLDADRTRKIDPEDFIPTIHDHTTRDAIGTHPISPEERDRITRGTPPKEPQTEKSALPTHPLAVIIAKMLAKDPNTRYRHANEVIADLSKLLRRPHEESADIRESFLQAARFVGRDSELATLNAALDATIARNGSMWLIGGESGVGKSRLMDELRILSMVQGMIVLRGQAIREGASLYEVWREPLRRLLLSVPVSDAEAGVLKTIVEDIETLLGRYIPPAPEVEAAVAERRLISTVQVLFSTALLSDPILLLLEDLQWAGKSLDLINALIPLLAGRCLMIVGTFRNDETPTLPELLPGSQVMTLSRLSPHHIEELSGSMLGEVGRTPHMVHLLQKETEGNVFFLVEIMRALAEEAGTLAAVGQMTLPASVFAGGMQRIIQRRLDRVLPNYRPLLQRAAVAGRQLDLAVLSLLSGDIRLDDWLTYCVNVAVFDSVDGKWRFSHDKLREQLLANLTDDERTTMNQQVAEAVESAHPAQLEQYAPALAHHWSQTSNRAKELHYRRIAGKQAMYLDSYNDALKHFERALQIAETDEQRAEFSIALGDAHRVQDRYDAARVHIENGLKVARELNNTRMIGRALLSLAWINARQGDLDAGLQLAMEAVDYAVRADVLDTLTECYYLVGMIRMMKGDLDGANKSLNLCLTLTRTRDDLAQTANALNALGAIAEMSGDVTRAQTLLTEAGDIARAIGDPGLAANVAGNLGRMLYGLGEYGEAETQFNRALEIFRQLGSVYGEAMVLYFLGFIKIGVNRPADALADLRASIGAAMNIGAASVALIALTGVARIWIRNQEVERAAELLGMILNHPDADSDVDIKREGEPLLDGLQSNNVQSNSLQSNNQQGTDIQASLERGKTRTIESYLAELAHGG
jgi:eukaryotic-like serine/threonine-protein kinase